MQSIPKSLFETFCNVCACSAGGGGRGDCLDTERPIAVPIPKSFRGRHTLVQVSNAKDQQLQIQKYKNT